MYKWTWVCMYTTTVTLKLARSTNNTRMGEREGEWTVETYYNSYVCTYMVNNKHRSVSMSESNVCERYIMAIAVLSSQAAHSAEDTGHASFICCKCTPWCNKSTLGVHARMRSITSGRVGSISKEMMAVAAPRSQPEGQQNRKCMSCEEHWYHQGNMNLRTYCILS